MTDTSRTATKINAVPYAVPTTRNATGDVFTQPGLAEKMMASREVLAEVRRERYEEVTYDEQNAPPALPSRWRRPDFIIPVVIAALAAVFGVLALLGATLDGNGRPSAPSGVVKTSAQPSPAARSTEQPRTLEAARNASQVGWDRFTANDYAGTYDTYGTAVHSRISRADYATLFRACNEALGTANRAAVTVEDPRWEAEPGDDVLVTIRHPLTTATRTMTYEDGRWVQRPQPETLEVIETFRKSGQRTAVAKHCTGS